jgi:hypothetical protein
MPVRDLLIQATVRLPDHGPVYLETRKYVAEGAARLIVEPWNTVSCLLFLALAVFWLVRLRGQYRRYAFLTACLPLVLIGGVGGTVYHAFRAHRVWLFMDWVPIATLCMAVSVYLWSRLVARWWYGLLVAPALFGLLRLNFRLFFPDHLRFAFVVTYGLMGLVIVLPALGVLLKTGFRHGIYPLLALVFFVIAIATRTTDAWWPGTFPMGTHWLWHVFGAAAGQMVAEYLYRLPAFPEAVPSA